MGQAETVTSSVVRVRACLVLHTLCLLSVVRDSPYSLSGAGPRYGICDLPESSRGTTEGVVNTCLKSKVAGKDM